MYPKMKTDLKGQPINQIYNPVTEQFEPLTEEILDYEADVTLDPKAVMLRDKDGNFIPQAYDKNLKQFVPITNDTYLYGGE